MRNTLFCWLVTAGVAIAPFTSAKGNSQVQAPPPLRAVTAGEIVGTKVSALSTVHTDYDLGVVEVGQTYRYTFVQDVPGGGGLATSFGTVTDSGSSDVTRIEDNCEGRTFTSSTTCTIIFEVTPTSAGEVLFTTSRPWSQTWPDPPSSASVMGSASGTLVGHLIVISTERVPRCEATAAGSIIEPVGQTVRESVPLVGVPFDLYYSSEFAGSYVSPYNTLGRKSFFNNENLTNSIHHYLYTDHRRLFRGDGTTQNVLYEVQDNGNLMVVDQGGSEIYIFDSQGKHLETRTALLNQLKYAFAYDAGNRLSTITDGFGKVTTLNRDSVGDLTSIVSSTGLTTSVTVNNGLVTDVTNPASEMYSMTYHSGTDLMETFSKPNGRTTTFYYDADGKLEYDQGDGGNYSSLWKDLSSAGQPVYLTSAEGRSKVYEKQISNSGKYRRWVWNPDGSYDYYSEPQEGFSSYFESSAGSREVFFEDSERFGRLLKRTRRSKLTGGNLTQKDIYYDQLVNYPSGVTPGHFNYSSIIDTVIENNNTFTSTFDPATKTTTLLTPMGQSSSTTIDSNENLVASQIGVDTPWAYTYDGFGRLSSQSQGSAKGMTFTYNTQGFLATESNALSETKSYAYDGAGRPTSVTLPDSRVISMSYDGVGNMTSITPPGRAAHVFNYNALDKVGGYEPPPIGMVSTDTVFSYNLDKQLTQILRPSGNSVSYSYDAYTGLNDFIFLPTETFTYYYWPNLGGDFLQDVRSSQIRNYFTYFRDMKRGDQQYRLDGLSTGRVRYYLDNYHRLDSREVRGNPQTAASTINYVYNDDSEPTQIGDMAISYHYPSGRVDSVTIGSIVESRTYDAHGDLDTVSFNHAGGSGTSLLYSYDLGRDLTGRINSKDETILGNSSSFDYSFDSAGRLTEVKKDGVVTMSAVYDSNSNRTGGVIDGVAAPATYDSQDRLVTFRGKSYSHNLNGELTEIEHSPTSSTLFNYDELGTLRSATLPNSDQVEYIVDALFRVAARTVNGVVEVRYLYDPDGRLVATATDDGIILQEYVYLPGNHSPDYLISGGTQYRIIKDHLGSPRLIVNVIDGTVAQQIEYNVYGKVLHDTNPGFQIYGFAGGVYDQDTKLVHFRAREYDTETGRWTSKDPIFFAGKDTNLYGYVLQDPMNWVDPMGLLRYNTEDTSRTGRLDGETLVLANCVEKCAGKELTVTGGSETKGHSPQSKHYSGQACDFGKNSNPDLDLETIKSCFSKCSKGRPYYGQEELDHYHLQIVPGRNGGVGFAEGVH